MNSSKLLFVVAVYDMLVVSSNTTRILNAVVYGSVTHGDEFCIYFVLRFSPIVLKMNFKSTIDFIFMRSWRLEQ